MAINAGDSFNEALEVFSSRYTDMAPSDLPPGLSPDNHDVIFRPGLTQTRPALNRLFGTPPEPTGNVVSAADFPLPSGDFYTVYLYESGNLWREDPVAATQLQIGSVAPGCQFKAEAAFDKLWLASYNPDLSSAFCDSPFCGADIPQYFDGKNLWRVTQDAPGYGPTFVNVPTLPVNLVVTTPTGTLTITAAQSSGRQTIYNFKFGSATTYNTITYTASSPVPVSWLNAQVTVVGLTGANAHLVNISGVIIQVSGSTFTFGVGTGGTDVQLTGQSGTATLAGNFLTRSGNIVTAYVGTTPAPNFLAGLFVQVQNSDSSQINGPSWSITSIARDATGLVTVKINVGLTNLPSGAMLYISATDTTDFPPSYQQVYQVTQKTSTSTTFTISDPTWGNGAVTSSAGGSVYQTWSGLFQIQTVGVDSNGNNFFTYFQLGPDITLAATGGTPQAQLQSQIPPGPRNAVLMFRSANGAITAPSIPIQLSVVGGANLLSATHLLLGPPGTAQRIIAFTPAYGSSYYYITPAIVPSAGGLPPVLSLGTIINDNTSTSAIVDFSDAQLTSATQIDIQGNDLFAQIVLAPCLGVIEYEGCIAWWGELNNIKNLINMGFDGGNDTFSQSGAAATGANFGPGVAWINPSNIASPAGYASVSLSTSLTSSQFLFAQGFGLIPVAPPGATIASLIVNVDYGALGIDSTGLTLSATLLKAGVPVGAPAIVPAVTGPGTFQLLFTAPALSVADLSSPTFGVQFQANRLSSGANTTSLNLKNAQIAYVVADNFPPGWSAADSTGGSVELVSNGTLGFSLQMTGAGGLQDALIEQSCYKDYFGGPIIAPNTNYLVRFKGASSTSSPGQLVFEIYSPSQGVIATASIAVATMAATLTWEVVNFQFFNNLAQTPSDSLFRIYLRGVTGAVTIDEVSIINADQPVLFQQMRISYFENPFGYDSETGVLATDGSAKFTGAFRQRNYLYGVTDGPLYQTQNNGSTEPNGWGFPEFADACDCFGPNAVTSTEELAWWVGRLGFRVFSGETPKKISQEIQPDWNLINTNLPTRCWATNDPDERCVYIGVRVPKDGGFNPEFIPTVYVMSYRSVDAAYNVPDPLHTSYSGKMIATDLCRKWTIWNVLAPCGAILTQVNHDGPGFTKEVYFGGQNFGNLYWLNPAKFTDDDYGIISSPYTTCFFFNHETEQNAPGLGMHRKLFDYLSLFVTGVGLIKITPLVDNLNNPWGPIPTIWNPATSKWEASGAPTGLPQYPLSAQLNHDLEWGLNVVGDRVAFRIEAIPLPGQTDAFFSLQHLVIAAREDRVFTVRGAVL